MTERFVSQVAHLKPQFKVKALSLALTLLSAAMAMPAYALQEISESDLGEATAEGIAFLPENTALIFRGAGTTTDANGVMTDAVGTTTETTATILSDRTKDTGYIRYIPVGPLTTAATNDTLYGATTGKADLFLYGLAISKGDRNYNKRFNDAADNANKIASWGTAENPWLLKVETASSVSNFSDTNCTGAADPLCKVSFLALEAPLYDLTLPTTSATGADAYNLKVAFWADAFVRLPSVVENMGATGTQFDVGGADRANRLRLQAVIDGISLNGSRVQLFQTLGGAVSGATGGQANDPFYNNTLGIAGLLRFNSGATTTLRAAFTTTGASRVYDPAEPNFTGPATTGFGSGCGNDSVDFQNDDCRYRFRDRKVTDTVDSQTWTPPANMPVLRLSTRETTNTALLATPAISAVAGGGIAPTFDPNEGLFLYGLNANIVLGSLAQPLIVGKEGSTNNLVLELTKIPNKAELYKDIYTRYAGDPADTVDPTVTYTGSTCNVHRCGTPIQVNGVDVYQGNTATHSSISMGSTEYSGTTTNLLTAYSGAEAVGVSFGQLNAYAQGSASIDRNDVEFQQRQQRSRNFVFTDRYRLRDDSVTGGVQTDPLGHPGGDCGTTLGTATCLRWYNRSGSHFDWEYLTSNTDGVKVFDNTGGSYTTSEMSGATAGDGDDADTIAGNQDDYGNTNNPGSPFAVGLYDCVNGVAGNNCDGATGTGSGKFGVGVSQLDAKAANRSWIDSSRTSLPWFKATGGSAAIVYQQGTGKTAHVIPTAISVGNPSALNNLGSAVIDGILIQHLKITTKGL